VADHVTAVDLADRLNTSPKQFRAWLRSERKNGHELLQAHQHGDNWIFTQAEAGRLATEYRRSH
jgi:hypothetical protein